ncbi:TapB family protein [Flavitalea antarctica]
MKSLLSLLLLSGLGLHASGQICNTYYFMKANSTVEQSHFDEKGKLSLKTEYKVGEVTPVDNGSEAAVMQKVVDKDGKIISEGKANIHCDGDNLFIDMKLSMPVGPVAPAGNVEATSRKVYMPYPKNMKPGDKLENARFSMSVDQGSIVQSMEMFVRNRQAEAEESITTPAGTWNCVRISFEMEMVSRAAGIPIRVRMKGKEWYAPGFGVVKTESLKNNGKLAGTSEITSIKNL